MKFLALLSMMFIVSGCSPGTPVSKKRFFWPPFSDEPKIEYIDYIQTDADLLEGKTGFFADAVVLPDTIEERWMFLWACCRA